MRSLQLGSIMAYLLLYLAPLLLLVMTVNCGQAMASPTPVVPDDADTPAAMVTEDINCMTEWLLIANSSRGRALTIPNTPAAIHAMLDEKVVKHQEQFFLSLILGYAPQLAADLKHCIRRRPSCPTADLTRRLPCSVAGECVFNATQQSAVCVCQPGMTGKRCDVDIDECSRPNLNYCDQPAVATCYNSPGSFGCECNTGFDGNGRVCRDLDECTTGVHQCNEHAMCNNTVGSYSCYCQSGYKGDGTNCQVDLCGSSANSELCYQIEAVKTYNKQLEEKLEARDLQINKLLSDMKVLTTIFVQQKTKVDQMEIQNKVKLLSIKEEMTSLNFSQQAQEKKTTQNFRAIQQHSAKHFESINATLQEEGQRNKVKLLSIKEDITSLNLSQQAQEKKTTQNFRAIQQHSAKHFESINATLQEEGQRNKVKLLSIKEDMRSLNLSQQAQEKKTKQHFRAIQQHSAKQFESINTTLQEEGQRTKQHLRNMQLHSAQQFAAINVTLTEEGQKTKQHFKSMKQHSVEQLASINATLQEERKKCGIVSWKTFTMEISTSGFRYWFSGVVFNKTRPDTVIRVVYTTSIGFKHGTHDWHCVKVSVRINGSDCSDPAPIRSGSSSNSHHHHIYAGVVSGICHINISGPLSFSTHIDAQCTTSNAYLGYYPGAGTLTSTLHIEELCNNQQN
ncbi:uncharacterized protein LOC135825192 [Sycon ciliatum]|uniref:uncharacterized protein LOC135825192 n=1 Tax=Sycon ciliatum TaxID=27933 RepID=UPI0031F65B21